MIYYTKDPDPTVSISPKSAVEFVCQNIFQTDFSILASGLESDIEHSQEYKDANGSRDFAVIDFGLSLANNAINKLGGIQHLCYKLNTNKARLIVSISGSISGKQYTDLIRYLNKFLGVQSSKVNENIKQIIKCKKINQSAVLSSNVDGKPLDYHPKNSSVRLDESKTLEATKGFIDSSYGKNVLADRDETTKFVDSLLVASLNEQLSNDYLAKAIDLLAENTDYNKDNWQDLFSNRLGILKSSASQRVSAPPFGSYIHFYGNEKQTMSISANLLTVLPEGVSPDPDFTLADAASFIEMAYPPYLLDQYGSDEDNMVIFDGSTGMWTHDDNILKSLLETIKPYSTDNQYRTFIMTFAAKARTAGRFIKPYSGSRYLLFNNCALDVATLKTYKLSDPFIRDLHFIQRCHINLDWNPRAILPQIPEMRLSDNGTWNPKDFFMGYADNNEEAYNYLMFGLSLGLFGGHNFGVHFDIQGQSRWGKTTLQGIYANLFENRTMMLPFASLNNQFPFTSYPLNTSVIWINECNTGVDELNDSFGTITYDGLADNQIRLQVKGKSDLVLDNPPQVYIDGTQFIRAKELSTGPAGRTLAYKLPRLTETLRNQIYAKDIKYCLSNKGVLQWLVKEFVKAYKKLIPEARMDNLKFNLANQQDMQLFPEVARNWRREFVVSSSTVDVWFTDEIMPYISSDPNKPTYFHKSVLYYMYKHAYLRDNPQDEKLIKIDSPDHILERVRAVLDSDNAYQVNVDASLRKQVGSPEKMNFDWKHYSQDFSTPYELEPTNWRTLDIFGHRISGWISVYKKEEDY